MNTSVLLRLLLSTLVVAQAACHFRSESSSEPPSEVLVVRIVGVESFNVWQLTAEPFYQTVIADIVKDPKQQTGGSRVRLVILFGSWEKSPLLRQVEGGRVLDEVRLATGVLIKIHLPIDDDTRCPPESLEPVPGDGSRGVIAPNLPCYHVDIKQLELDASAADTSRPS